MDLNKYFKIEKQQITAKVNMSITLDKNDYLDSNFFEHSDHFFLPGILTFYIPSEEIYVPLVVNYDVKLYKTEDVTETNPAIYTISYIPDELVIAQETYEKNMDMPLLVALFQGRLNHIKKPEVLANSISDMLNIDNVYIELVVSNMFRMEDGTLARHKGKAAYAESEIFSQNKIARTDSWMSALSYGYLDSGIERGLVKGQESENNPIERVLNYDL